MYCPSWPTSDGNSYPVARMSDDEAADRVRADMKRGVIDDRVAYAFLGHENCDGQPIPVCLFGSAMAYFRANWVAL